MKRMKSTGETTEPWGTPALRTDKKQLGIIHQLMRYQLVWASVLSGGGDCSAPFPTVPSGVAREQTGR